MACVTLKRPLDHFDVHPRPNPHHQPPQHRPPPSKRRRYGQLTSRQIQRRRELFESGSYCDLDESTSTGRSSTRFSRASTSSCSLDIDDSESPPSIFCESKMAREELANRFRDELKRLKKRKQIVTNTETSSIESCRTGNGSPEPMMDDSTAIKTANNIIQNNSSGSKLDNIPIFTLRQMTLICEKMCQERTVQIREEFTKILQQKLSEQYEAFVKFIDHQIQQRFNESQLPSYLS